VEPGQQCSDFALVPILKIGKFTFFVVKNYVFYNKKSGFLIFRIGSLRLYSINGPPGQVNKRYSLQAYVDWPLLTCPKSIRKADCSPGMAARITTSTIAAIPTGTEAGYSLTTSP